MISYNGYTTINYTYSLQIYEKIIKKEEEERELENKLCIR